MTCQLMQDRMSDDPQAFMADPEAQAHLEGCPQCRAILDRELRVRAALAAFAEQRRPEVSEELLARLRAIPRLYPREGSAAAGAIVDPEPSVARDMARPGGLARRVVTAWSAALGAARERTRLQTAPRSSRPRRPGAFELLLAGSAAAVVALLLWPRGQTPPLGHSTATPTAAPTAPPATAVSAPLAGPTSRPPATEASAPAANEPGEDAHAGTPAITEILSTLGPGAPSDATTPAGDRVQDFCVQADQGRVLFVLAHGKAESAEAQAAVRSDLRILQLPLAALLADTATAEGSTITPTLFADLADLGGPPHTALTDIDCAADGRVLVSRQNQESEAGSRGDLWLLDGEGRRLNAQSLLWDLDEAPADAELSPDGQAALVLGAWEGRVHVLRLDDLAAGSSVTVATGVGLASPGGAPGGRLVWSPGGSAFLLQTYAAEGDSIDVFRWNGSQAERLRQGPASVAAGTPPAEAATLQVTDEGAPFWDTQPRGDGRATADRLLRLSEGWLTKSGRR